VKVLIVDDSAIMRMMVKNILGQILPAEVFEAGNGKAAIEHLIAGPVDLVLVDVHMPEMGGLDLLKTVKGLPATKDIPVIVVSSDTDQVQIDEAMSLGAVTYVTKPFRKEALEEALKLALPER
jgi:CheY-like chemotaxis protein